MNVFSKLANALKKTQQAVGFKLKQLFKIGAFGDDFFDELETILLTSDVGSIATAQIVETLRGKMEMEKISDELRAKEALKVVLTEILRQDKFEFDMPVVFLVVGVNGVGKTTSIGKLANLFARKGNSVIVAAADTFRAAASDQLDVWAKRANVKIVKHQEGADPAAVVFDAVASAKSRQTNVLIVDTAGRLHNKKNLMEELKKIDRIIDREYPQACRKNLIVLDATTGQNALVQVEMFNEAIAIDGIVLTKLDGTAKGGAIVGIKAEYDLPVAFVGVGEAIEDLIDFDVEEFVDAML